MVYNVKKLSLQDGYKLLGQTSQYLNIRSAGLNSRGNYSCQGEKTSKLRIFHTKKYFHPKNISLNFAGLNQAGSGLAGWKVVEVGARPRLLTGLSPQSGAGLYSEVEKYFTKTENILIFHKLKGCPAGVSGGVLTPLSYRVVQERIIHQ